MSRRDRDRSFDKALARHFSNAPLHDAAGPLCPDAETLAAYHENALAPEELLSWKQHFASCSRCQELLKHLGTTDNIVLQPLEAEKPAGLRAPSYPVIEPRRSPLSLMASYWRWVFPAGALAAGLLAWVVIRQRPSPSVEMVNNQRTASLTQPAWETNNAVNPPKAPANAEAPEAAASRETDQAPAESSSKTLGRLSPPDASKQQPMEPAPAAADRGDQKAAGAHHGNERQRTEDAFSRHGLERPLVKPRALERRSGTAADLRKEAAPLSAETPALPEAVAQSRMTLPETISAQPSQSKAPAALAGTRPEEIEKLQSARSSKGGLGFRNISVQSPATIRTPDGQFLWRVGVAGMIQRTVDGGKTWVAQTSPVAADLLAGSAVSDQVCWIIGRAGTILRTTDGGTHWLKLSSPSTQDLSAVQATDAQQAVIVDASTRRFKTTDGGASWTEVPPE